MWLCIVLFLSLILVNLRLLMEGKEVTSFLGCYVHEVLRQPLEDGKVTISRAAISLTYPAQFMLAAAMNPCPCGYFSDPHHECTCTPPVIQRYMSRMSGPLLDRIDIHVEVPAVKYKELSGVPTGEASSDIRERVNRTKHVQLERFRGGGASFATRIWGRGKFESGVGSTGRGTSSCAWRSPNSVCQPGPTTGS